MREASSASCLELLRSDRGGLHPRTEVPRCVGRSCPAPSPWRTAEGAGSLPSHESRYPFPTAVGNICSRLLSFWTLKKKAHFYLQPSQLIAVRFSLDLAFTCTPTDTRCSYLLSLYLMRFCLSLFFFLPISL